MQTRRRLRRWPPPFTLFMSSPLSSLGEFIPDHPILSLLHRAAAHPSFVAAVRALHGLAVTAGLIHDPFAASRLVQFCLQALPADLRYAAAIFDSLRRPDVYTWNAMLAGHVSHGSTPGHAVVYYFRMRAAAAPPNSYTFALLVKACMRGGGVDADAGLAKEVHGQVVKCGVEDGLVIKNSLLSMYCSLGLVVDARLLFETSSHLDSISWNTMISVYGKDGDVGRARVLFDRMPERSLVSWSAMMDGYVQSGEYSETLRLFNEMQADRVKPDAVMLVSVLKACAQLGALDQGRWIHVYIDRNELHKDANVVLGTALVDMYSKCGCIDVALQVFDSVLNGDVVLWNAMIGGLAMHGDGDDVLKLFRKMEEKGITPNETTFLSILSACVHAGMVEEGIGIFESMKYYGLEPQREHYGCLADLLGRAGRVEEAENVLLQMPMETQASQWGALMSACRMHKNVDVGERVGKRLISLEPYDGGRYVLLANTFAAAGRWEDARETRKAMEEKGIKKETGASWIEYKGAIHEFVVGDMTHPQSREMYALLSEMERKLEVYGYVRDTSQSLVDVENEEEKRMALSYHSEKLAIAFGILNTGQGALIRIVKNLRICRDCHTYMKMVSKVFQREIIVRDRNRFHRFREGSCTCKDYW